MAKLRINKIDAARRQIVTAIGLLFSGGDPVAIHTLVGAGWRILRDLCEKQATPYHLSFKATIRPGKEKEFWTAINSAVDFFKHADRDADAILEVDEGANDLVILLAITYYIDLGNQQSVEMKAFSAWFCLIHPHLFEAPLQEQFRKLGANDWPGLARAEQLENGRKLLNLMRGRSG